MPVPLALISLGLKAKEMASNAAENIKNAARKVVSTGSGMFKFGSKVSGGVSQRVDTVASNVGYAPEGKLWKQPAFVLVIAIFLYLYLRMIKLYTVGNWLIVSVIVSIVVGIVFKEPRKGYVILLLPATIYVLQRLNLLTPANSALAIGFVTTMVLFTFTQTREFANKILTIGVYLFGGVMLLFISAWGQMMMETPFPHVVTFILIFGYLMFIFTRPTKLKFLAIPVNIIALYLVIAWPAAVSTPGTPLYSALDSQHQAWVEMYEGITGSGKMFFKSVGTQMLVATGQYEMGVEAQSQKPLGVFLENVGSVSRVVDEDKKINTYATLRVDSFVTAENLSVKVKCFVDGRPRVVGNISQGSVFSVQQSESVPLDCIMPALDVGVGANNIVFDASFEFITSAFLKSYFMHQDTIREYRRRQIDPLDAFKVTDKSPFAVFTGGPVMLGMGVGDQPIPLPEGELGPTLSITFDRNWLEGELYDISKLTITVPPGLVINNVGGNEVYDCTAPGDVEQTCTLEGDILEELFESPVDTPKTVRVQTRVQSADNLLSNAPIALRSFKVSVNYVYNVKKKIPVIVRAKEAVVSS